MGYRKKGVKEQSFLSPACGASFPAGAFAYCTTAKAMAITLFQQSPFV
ncbi:hypothetical protein BREVNS_1764 [Brevinematales bacterium NS]|nr:hypothetical protein [Brevinematales bacterium]QJR22514.1 hypothetical protein BREVNS_1764 [Brevinematales bacterium NS]